MRKILVDTGKRREKIVYEEYSIEENFVQMYINSNEIFYKVQSPSAYILLMWCLINMDKFNHVTLNKRNRSVIIAEVVSSGGKRYSDNTIKDAIGMLAKSNVIVSFNDNNEREAAYMINPSYFWKSKSQGDRLESIKAYEIRKKQNEEN